MNFINNYNDLSRVFDKYNVATTDFKTKLTIVLPSIDDVDILLKQFLSNVELSRQHEYTGSNGFDVANVDRYEIFNDLPMYNMLLNATSVSNNLMYKSNMEILRPNKDLLNVWKIYIVDNLMWNLPFTLGQVIFIPLKQMQKSLDINSYYNLSKTLIHERIHVLQRLNPKDWIDYIYYKNKNWVIAQFNTPLFNFLNDYKVEKLMDYMQVTNPDTIYNDFKYVLRKDNNLYYGVLYLNPNTSGAASASKKCCFADKEVKIQWFQIFDNKNKQYDKENYAFYLEKLDKEIYNYEHPFEEYAYKISEEITKVNS